MAGKASQDQLNESQHYFTYKMQMCKRQAHLFNYLNDTPIDSAKEA